MRGILRTAGWGRLRFLITLGWLMTGSAFVVYASTGQVQRIAMTGSVLVLFFGEVVCWLKCKAEPCGVPARASKPTATAAVPDSVQTLALDALRSREETLERAQRVAHVGSWQHDLQTNQIILSAELYRLVGLEPAQTPPSEDILWRFLHPADVSEVRTVSRKCLQTGEPYRLDCRIVQRGGNVRWIDHQGHVEFDDAGRPRHFIGVAVDITDRKRAETRLAFEASHDGLTGLANRMLLIDRLTRALGIAAHTHSRVAVVFLDLDHFKGINDTLGHPAGDRVLSEVGRRLRAGINADGIVARPGGDEFVLVLSKVSTPDDVARIVAGLLESLAVVHHVDGCDIFVTASVGISLYPDDGTDAEEIMRNADTAMYQVKEAGRNDFRFFAPTMHATAMERLLIEDELHHAVERDELLLHYQPIVHSLTGAITGVEALLRWNHPVLGIIGPERFMPIAEANGLIVSLGDWVLQAACRQAQSWRATFWPDMFLSVNLSARQLRNAALCSSVETILRECGYPAHALELELTESAVMPELSVTIATMTALRALGVRIAIDDFGIGYSPVSYLKTLPVDTVKIHRVFVNDLPFDRGDAAIVRAVTTLAHELCLDVIAGGVETQAQAEFLRDIGVDALQGRLFSSPLPTDDFEKAYATLSEAATFRSAPV